MNIKKNQEPFTKQALSQAAYQSKTHTEDCLDANDDTSAMKGKCICPKPAHIPTPLLEDSIQVVVSDIERGLCDSSTLMHFKNIVRAVNSFDAMLKALRVAEDYIGRMGAEQSSLPYDAYEVVFNAIKQAEGQ